MPEPLRCLTWVIKVTASHGPVPSSQRHGTCAQRDTRAHTDTWTHRHTCRHRHAQSHRHTYNHRHTHRANEGAPGFCTVSHRVPRGLGVPGGSFRGGRAPGARAPRPGEWTACCRLFLKPCFGLQVNKSAALAAALSQVNFLGAGGGGRARTGPKVGTSNRWPLWLDVGAGGQQRPAHTGDTAPGSMGACVRQGLWAEQDPSPP